MGGLFGKSKKAISRVTEQDKAILQLKQQRDRIKQYQKRIEGMLEKDRVIARQLLQEGKRERAKLILRKKKFQEQLLDKTDAQLENLQQLVHDLEFAQVEMQVLDGLKKGNEALKKVHDVISIDEVERILEETKEGVEKQREIDELLSGALSKDEEESVEAELADIIKESLPEVPASEEEAVELPEVPTDEVGTREKEKKVAQKEALEVAQ